MLSEQFNTEVNDGCFGFFYIRPHDHVVEDVMALYEKYSYAFITHLENIKPCFV